MPLPSNLAPLTAEPVASFHASPSETAARPPSGHPSSQDRSGPRGTASDLRAGADPKAEPLAAQRDRSEAPSLALVHDWLNQDGGAEVVLDVLHAIFPDAPVYTAIADPTRVPRIQQGRWDIRTSWLDRLPGIHRHHQPYLPLYPLAWRSTSPRDQDDQPADVILSNKSGFCHGIRSGHSLHLCYCLTPTRYVWQPEVYMAHEPLTAAARFAVRALLPALRSWDRAAADRVDRFIAISSTVADRIRRYYGRESDIIFPPVDLDAFQPSATRDVADHYVIVSRLVPYKRIDLAVRAFNQLGRRLVIIGDGRDRHRLESLAGPTVELRGRLPDAELRDLLARSRALIWPGVEDFGLAPVEAMASGRPVIARRAGGVLDTVIEGETGLFFDQPTARSLSEAVLAADTVSWNPARIRHHAQRFDRSVFEESIRAYVATQWAVHRRPDAPDAPPGLTA